MDYLVSIHNDTIVQYNKKATNVNRQVSLVFKSDVWDRNINPLSKTMGKPNPGSVFVCMRRDVNYAAQPVS